MEWNTFDINYTGTAALTTIGIYPELIGKQMVVFSKDDGSAQVIVHNIGDGSVCDGRNTFISSDNKYNTCREFTVNFNTGEVKHRQQTVSGSSYYTYTKVKYR